MGAAHVPDSRSHAQYDFVRVGARLHSLLLVLAGKYRRPCSDNRAG